MWRRMVDEAKGCGGEKEARIVDGEMRMVKR